MSEIRALSADILCLVELDGRATCAPCALLLVRAMLETKHMGNPAQ